MEKEVIIDWFVEHSNISVDEIECDLDINYLEKGLIDSFGFLELISFCENQFGYTFADEDFSNDNIFTINGLINILKE